MTDVNIHYLYIMISTKKFITCSDGHKEKLVVMEPGEEQPGYGRKDRTGMLWIHGGGYREGMAALPKYIGRAKACVEKYGTVVVSPGYRLSIEAPFPAAVDDCYDALVYFAEHAEEFGVRNDQIFVGGESAGGGLCVAMCLMARDRGSVKIAAQFPLYPMLDDRDTETSAHNFSPGWNTPQNHLAWKLYLRDQYGTDEVSKYAAPARETDYSDLPPCYTFCCTNEPFLAETKTYIENLQKAGIAAEVDIYEGLIHGFDVLMPRTKVAHEAARKFEEHFVEAQKYYFKPQI